MRFYKIVAGSSASVPGIRSDSLHFAMTSPPYLDVKPYDRDNPENLGNYQIDEQLKMAKPIYQEVFRVLQPGRKFVMNVPDMVSISPIDGRSCHIPLFLKTLNLLEEIGFIYEMPYVWNKLHSRSANNNGSWPYPVGVVLVHDFEPLVIMRKPGTPDRDHVSDAEYEASKMSPEYMGEAMYNSISLVGESHVDFHIAPYPVELVKRLISVYTFVGETVYDPFLGSGTTLLAAKQLERSGIGCEIGYKTPDGTPWIKRTQERIGWNDGDVYGEQVLYEVIDSEGNVIDSSTVPGRGILSKEDNILLDSKQTMKDFQSDVVINDPDEDDILAAFRNKTPERKDPAKKKKEIEAEIRDDKQERLF